MLPNVKLMNKDFEMNTVLGPIIQPSESELAS